MNIVIVSGEIAPFSKSGGLGDVTGALARTLAARGHQVVTVSPRYKGGAGDPVHQWSVPMAGTHHHLRFHEVRAHGARHLFIDHTMFQRQQMYGSYADNHLRFAVLSRGAIEAARFAFEPGAPVLFHIHDWHAALLPLYLEACYRPVGLMPRSATVLTLHNPMHQGRFPGRFFRELELPPRWFEPTTLEWYGDLNLLKGGILHSDVVTTVSQGFARELQSKGGGFGLDTLLRLREPEGILNGIDPNEWNPATDKHIAAPFDADDLRGKALCKTALQEELGLPVSDAPLVGSVGRLDPQKGVELLIESIPWLVDQGVQVCVLGSAQPAHRRYEQQLRELERRWPDQVRAWIGFSEAMAHKIEAGADLFVMPSRFEPCGLNQMYSMRYGTPPVVRWTGGLADSVHDDHTGWVFGPFEAWNLREALWRALQCYRLEPERFQQVRRNGMSKDWSWTRAIARYESAYERAFAHRRVDPDKMS